MRTTPIVLLAVTAAILTGCTTAQNRPTDQTTPAPVATAMPAASAMPPATPTTTPSATPTIPVTVTASPAPSQVPAQPSALPPSPSAPAALPSATPTPGVLRILAVSLNPTVIHSGDVVAGEVRTTLDIASVEVRIAGYSTTMNKVGGGDFRMTYTVPSLPFFIRGNFDVQIIARDTQGKATARTTSVTIQ